MSFEFADEYTKMSTAAFASMKELSEITAKTFEKLAQQNMELVSSTLQTGVKQLNLLSESKGYKDLLSNEANLVAEYNQSILDSVKKTAEIITGTKDEFTSWLEKGFEGIEMPAPLKKAVAKKAA